MEAELKSRGLIAVETCPGPPGVTFVLGRRGFGYFFRGYFFRGSSAGLT
jgi:hypothetical protein